MTKEKPKAVDRKRGNILRWALRGRAIAEEAVAEALKKFWPIGAPATWKKGASIQTGTIVDHAGEPSGRIKVKNSSTDEAYWIDAEKLEEADGYQNANPPSGRSRKSDPANRQGGDRRR